MRHIASFLVYYKHGKFSSKIASTDPIIKRIFNSSCTADNMDIYLEGVMREVFFNSGIVAAISFSYVVLTLYLGHLN